MTRRDHYRALIALLVIAAALALTLSACGPSSSVSVRLPGDPRAGLSIYKYAGCASCHAISQISVGSLQGPPLNGIGSKHDAQWFQAMLASHARDEHLLPLTTTEQRDLASYLATLR